MSEKIFVLALLVLLVLYLLSGSNNKSEPIHNKGTLQQSITNSDTESLPNNTDNSSDSEESQSSLINDIVSKMRTKNSASGSYKNINYANGERSQESNLDRFFTNVNPANQPSNSFGLSNDGKNYASYIPGSSEKQQDDDKFDSGALMPQEQKDWFDDPQAKKGIDSPHLINIFRPTGVNTIQSTLKNASWDIRGAPSNPKHVVSPWGNSSYEPDTNLKNGSLCI